MRTIITSKSGVDLQLSSDDGVDIGISFDRNGKFCVGRDVSLVNDPEHGYCLRSGGALIRISDEAKVQFEEFKVSAAAEKISVEANAKIDAAKQKAEKAAFMASAAGQSWLLTKKMNSQFSDY